MSIPEQGEWYSQNHDDEPRDQEVDLGDGWWAAIGPNHPHGWSWSLYDHWSVEDLDATVAEGFRGSEEAAKEAVLLYFEDRHAGLLESRAALVENTAKYGPPLDTDDAAPVWLCAAEDCEGLTTEPPLCFEHRKSPAEHCDGDDYTTALNAGPEILTCTECLTDLIEPEGALVLMALDEDGCWEPETAEYYCDGDCLIAHLQAVRP